VHRKIFFAISLAIPHLFLLPPDADLPQFAQKAGTLAACEYGVATRIQAAIKATNGRLIEP
jgi:hypothetical protein